MTIFCRATRTLDGLGLGLRRVVLLGQHAAGQVAGHQAADDGDHH